MGAFWNAVAKLAVKLAVYAKNHPDEVVALVRTAKTIKKA